MTLNVKECIKLTHSKFQKQAFPSWYSSQKVGERIKENETQYKAVLLPFSLLVQTKNPFRMEDL